jgi:two-component system OmpR family response regulator
MGAKSKVLVVDDEPIVLDFVEKYLKLKGFEVQVAANSVSALGKLDSFTPDVMLLDIGMPGIDGYDLARAITAKPKFANVPIVFLSGYDVGVDAARSFAAGGSVYIHKPISGEALVETLNGLLGA